MRKISFYTCEFSAQKIYENDLNGSSTYKSIK